MRVFSCPAKDGRLSMVSGFPGTKDAMRPASKFFVVVQVACHESDIYMRRSHSPSIRLTNHHIHVGRIPADLYRSVAQLGRATVSKTVCCRFDSCPACHFASKQLNTNMPVWRKQADAGNLKFLVYTACGFKSRYRHHIMHRTLVGRA